MLTLNDFLAKSHIDNALKDLLACITQSCVEIGDAVRMGAMAGILGSAEETNVQGETQKKLDIISNDIIKKHLSDSGLVRGLASEEEDYIVDVDKNGSFLVTFDPLDGSSNIDINSLVGTIFSVMDAPETNALNEQHFLQNGREQRAAGYVLYGPSTMLVFSTGDGVSMFTLNPKTMEFILTTENVQIPEDTKEYAINMSNQRHWIAGMQDYIAELNKGVEGSRDKNFNMRWVAAMVGDVHRVLSRGGIFIYPWDKKDPNKPGKLRLMYEANPMALLIEQAGGLAATPDTTILDIKPERIHQRVPVILGSKNEVKLCLKAHK